MAVGEIAGKNVVVTGGAKGLGFAISTLFVERGAKVCIIDIDKPGLEDAVARLGGEEKAVGIVGDLRRRQDAHRAFDAAADALGTVDILVNNAGVYPRKPILEIDDDDWDYTFDVNLRAMFHTTVAAANHMKSRRSGAIVSIASIDAYIPYAKNAHYAAAKAAVISFTKSFAQELAPDGILVNAVSPGPIDTPNLRALGIYEDLAKSTPLSRVATPEDIAEVVFFLASGRNRYMTGETVIASGGIIMV
ncbi:NAD(P)-dependent dehydrogenase (short-subunit alcohol dehydrogenase family) [Rhodoligotrophos appendicifer]|uniref:SDR family NAD(P)-dependent oxidoreductase n=1 Tax=Rhodoligotrophos appendicifer TaxID=987056 RepID=UPI001FE37176|nr:SDR family oxidoreductase [Rhodoligotrophos appendicifer]